MDEIADPRFPHHSFLYCDQSCPYVSPNETAPTANERKSSLHGESLLQYFIVYCKGCINIMWEGDTGWRILDINVKGIHQ